MKSPRVGVKRRSQGCILRKQRDERDSKMLLCRLLLLLLSSSVWFEWLSRRFSFLFVSGVKWVKGPPWNLVGDLINGRITPMLQNHSVKQNFLSTMKNGKLTCLSFSWTSWHRSFITTTNNDREIRSHFWWQTYWGSKTLFGVCRFENKLAFYLLCITTVPIATVQGEVLALSTWNLVLISTIGVSMDGRNSVRTPPSPAVKAGGEGELKNRFGVQFSPVMLSKWLRYVANVEIVQKMSLCCSPGGHC